MVGRAIAVALFVLPVVAGACAGSKGRGASSDGDEPSDDGGKERSTGDSAPKAMEQILEAHNRYRKKHCAPPLEWSDDIAEQAQSWADKLEKRGCAFDHSSSGYGENLAAGTESVMDADRAVEIWYEGTPKWQSSHTVVPAVVTAASAHSNTSPTRPVPSS